MNPILVGKAQRVMWQLGGWQADRNEPPSLRDGYRYPGDAAIELAQMILDLHNSEMADADR